MKTPALSRRAILKMASFAPAFAFGKPVLASLSPPSGLQAPGYHRLQMGEAAITIVSDGHFEMPVSELGVNADRKEVEQFLLNHSKPTDSVYRHTNHLFVELGDAKVLVDVGSGDRFVNSVGRLLENLESAGIDPYEITHVVITHAHPDHIWGLRDGFDEPILPDAEYIIGGNEMDHWLQNDYVNKVAPEMQQIVLGAVNSINTDGLEWTRAVNDQEIAPGIRVIETPGHTAGHMSVVVESGGNSLIALGDCMTNAYMDFSHPEWVIARDENPETTVKTRKRVLDMTAADGMAVLGYHFPFPGIGHVLRDGDAYRFIPATLQWAE